MLGHAVTGRRRLVMNRLAFRIALALAFSAPAFAQDGYDPESDIQGVDTNSPVDRQAAETYRKNMLPPVPAAPLPADRPADMRPKIITGSADRQAQETYRKNALPPAPATRHRHRHRHHRVASDRVQIDRRADDAIVEPAATTIPPHD
jgi:hypothetical protein